MQERVFEAEKTARQKKTYLQWKKNCSLNKKPKMGPK
jgi:invasion protein IalB